MRAGIMGTRSPPLCHGAKTTIPNELLDQLWAGGAMSAASEQGGLLDSLKKALTACASNAEMVHHFAGDDGTGNTQNGYGRKTVMNDNGKLRSTYRATARRASARS